jgi:hypothetical protein
MKDNTGNKVHQLLTLAALFIFILIFLQYYIDREQFIYYWDFGAYWEFTTRLGTIIRENISEGLLLTWNSIGRYDYNFTPGLIIALIFGDSIKSRHLYITSIAILYAIPSIILLVSIIKKSLMGLHKVPNDTLILTTVNFIVVLSTLIWAPVIKGYIDIVGLFPMLLAIYIYWTKILTKPQTHTVILISMVLVLPFIFRRWYAFSVISFLFTTSIIAIINSSKSIKKTIRPLFRIFQIGGISLIILYLLFNELFLSLFRNYSDMHDAYRPDFNLLKEIFRLFTFMGSFSTILFLLGITFQTLSWLKHKQSSFISLFSLISLIFTFIIFFTAQNFGQHNYYLILLPILYFQSYSIFTILTSLKNKRILSIAFTLIICFLASLNFIKTFIPIEFPPIVNKVLTTSPNFPYYRNDLSTITELFSKLETIDIQPHDKIYTLASSRLFNSSTVNSYCFFTHHNKDLCKHLNIPHSHVDKIDGLPHELFKSRYIIVVSPNWSHLNPERQLVVGYFLNNIIKQQEFGLNYKIVTSVTQSLEDGSKIHIFEKKAEYTPQQIDKIENFFFNKYPDYRKIFTSNQDRV